MKFSNGQWLTREGVHIFNPAQAYEVDTDQQSITVCAPCQYIHHRGATLGGPVLTVKYSSPMPDVIKVQVFHYKGALQRGPRFELQESAANEVGIINNDETASLQSRNLKVKIDKKTGWQVEFLYNEKKITTSDNRSMAYVTTEDSGTFIREQLSLGVGECVYGLGEHFTPFVKNGQVVDIWNKDGGTSSEQAYKNVPFYITNKGYGVFVNHPEEVSFEVGSEKVTKVQFSVPGECLEYYIIGGTSMKNVLENYTALTGKPSLPPAWSFGLWLTTSFTTNYDEQTVTSFIDGMAERDVPLHVFHFDCFWMKEFQWCDFEWDKRVFPDPVNMLERLKKKGLKICVWINPYIGQKSKLFDEGMEKGYLLKKVNGDVWQWDLWQPGMGIVDFTNPKACKWYQDKLRELVAMGVDCFKTDFGERIPTDVVYYDGSDPMKMHNYYSYVYNKVVFEVLKEEKGEKEAVVFARSATAGGQKFPIHWGGDNSARYESMAESLRGGLSLCLSGFGFWSHDIGGFEDTAPPDIYKRWAAFGLLSSHSRLHGNSSYRVPWMFGEEAVDVVRFFTKLKCSLMPYLFRNACETAKSGIPMMRAMVLEFNQDPACDYLDRQYLLGDSLLVAPVFREDGNVSYYLPKGTWTNFITGEKVQGGSWHEENHNFFSLPIMARPNTIIAVGSNNQKPDYDYAQDVTLHVFELEEDKRIFTTVNNIEGKTELEISLTKKNGRISVEAKGEKPFTLLLRGIQQLKSAETAEWKQEALGVRILPQKGVNTFEIVLE